MSLIFLESPVTKWRSLSKYPLKSEVPDILMLYHDSHHPGINATLTNIRREYYWNGMCEEVRLYVSILFIESKLKYNIPYYFEQ